MNAHGLNIYVKGRVLGYVFYQNYCQGAIWFQKTRGGYTLFLFKRFFLEYPFPLPLFLCACSKSSWWLMKLRYWPNSLFTDCYLHNRKLSKYNSGSHWEYQSVNGIKFIQVDKSQLTSVSYCYQFLSVPKWSQLAASAVRLWFVVVCPICLLLIPVVSKQQLALITFYAIYVQVKVLNQLKPQDT